MISVNPTTFVITIPKADLPLIQTTPTEIHELNLNTFRMWLKDWEDSEGMLYTDTHRHNTEVTVGGLTLARVIELLPPYTVTFEDGQYAVNMIGANSNVGDRVNVNQVSVRSANSAGLVNIRATEFPAYSAGIVINPLAGVSGTAFPAGTLAAPSNNLADALLIATVRGVKQFVVQGTLVIPPGADLRGYVLKGQNTVGTQIVAAPGALIDGCFLHDTYFVESSASGLLYVRDCFVNNVTGLRGVLLNCLLSGVITPFSTTLEMPEALYIIDGKSAGTGVLDALTPVIDLAGLTNVKLVLRNYAGSIVINNSTHAGNILYLDAGSSAHIYLNPSNTAGSLAVGGIAHVHNTSTMTVDQHLQFTPSHIQELWKLAGLDATKPVTATKTRRFVGDDTTPVIDQTITGNGRTLSTITRT